MAAVTTTVGFDDFDEICRLCLCAGELESLFDNSLNDVVETFKVLTNIQVEEGDTLPSKLCSNCLTHLITLKSFIDRCIKSDKTLKEIVNISNAHVQLVPERIQIIEIVDEEDKVMVKLDTDEGLRNTLSSSEEAAELKQNTNYKCTICTKSFSNNIYLSGHLLLHKIQDFDSDSALSDNVDPLDSIEDHITFDDVDDDDDNDKKHKSSILQRKCDNCKEDVISWSYHYKIKKECKPQFKCTICDRVLKTKSALTSHLRAHLSTESKQKQKINNKRYVEGRKKQHERPCENCGDLITNIWRHCKKKKECTPLYKCTICDKEMSRQRKQLHLKLHHKPNEYTKRVECGYCIKSFPTKHNMLRHRRTVHEKIKAFKCSFCDKALSTAYAQRNHEEIHSGGPALFMCEECGQMFKSQQTLRRHHHDKCRNKCHICDKSFSSRTVLKQHLSIHTGDKSFLCSICGTSFRTYGGLYSHRFTHTTEKPYKCSFCDEKFARPNSLKRHTLIHTGEKPFRCEICPREFKQRTHLVHHERIHTGEKPYRCDFCDRAFAIRSNLTAHQRVHTGERFSCEICKRSFYDKKYLNKHVLKEH